MSLLKLNDENEFERVLIRMVELSRAKRSDYASDENMLSNFEDVVQMMKLDGYDVREDILQMIARKFSRIVNLRGRSALNEAVQDSVLDLAVYAVLLCVAYDRAAYPVFVGHSVSGDERFVFDESIRKKIQDHFMKTD